MMQRPTAAELAWAVFIPRTILGFVYLFAGVHKIVNVGPLAYGQAMAMTDGARFLPAALRTAVGPLVPFMGVALGRLRDQRPAASRRRHRDEHHRGQHVHHAARGAHHRDADVARRR